MKNRTRREFLTLGLKALPALALTACAGSNVAKFAGIATPAEAVVANSCKKPGGPSANQFPNLMVTTQAGRKSWFYDDLIKGKVVGINFMSIKSESKFPVTQNLASVQELLGEKLGKDVFLVSITTDPENDTPQALEAFAKEHGVKDGWAFVTGSAEDMQKLYAKLGSHGHDHEGSGASHHVWRYGNENYARWASSHAMAKPHQLAQRLSWVEVNKSALISNAKIV